MRVASDAAQWVLGSNNKKAPGVMRRPGLAVGCAAMKKALHYLRARDAARVKVNQK